MKNIDEANYFYLMINLVWVLLYWRDRSRSCDIGNHMNLVAVTWLKTYRHHRKSQVVTFLDLVKIAVKNGLERATSI